MTCVGPCIVANYLHDWNKIRNTVDEATPNVQMYRDGLIVRWHAQKDHTPQVSNTSLLACPSCRARICQACRSTAGNPRVPHVNRLVSRRCPCGAVLQPKKQLCETCRSTSRTATYAQRERRQPTSKRRMAA